MLSDDVFAMNLVYTGDCVSHINWYVWRCLVDSSPGASCESSKRFIGLSSSLHTSAVIRVIGLPLSWVLCALAVVDMRLPLSLGTADGTIDFIGLSPFSSISLSRPVGSSPVHRLPVWASLRCTMECRFLCGVLERNQSILKEQALQVGLPIWIENPQRHFQHLEHELV